MKTEVENETSGLSYAAPSVTTAGNVYGNTAGPVHGEVESSGGFKTPNGSRPAPHAEEQDP